MGCRSSGGARSRPAVTGVLLRLTPLAAVGLALPMVGVALIKLRLGKPGHIAMNAALFVAALFSAL